MKRLLHCLLIFMFSMMLLLLIPVFLVTAPEQYGLKAHLEVNTWLNYYGAVFGGSITLIGVAWTIKKSDKRNTELLSIQYKPIIEFKGFVVSKKPCGTREIQFGVAGLSGTQYTANNENLSYICPLVFGNIGRGETCDTYIEKLEIKENGIFGHLCPRFTSRQYVGDIIAGQELQIKVSSVPLTCPQKPSTWKVSRSG